MRIKAGVDNFESRKKFLYENGFYLTSDISRIGKALAQYELYKRIVTLPGAIVECGVFKGASFLRLATYRELLENSVSRKLIGFDIFGEFPATHCVDDKQHRASFIDSAGAESISCSELDKVMKLKGIKNFELIKGDIIETVPKYVTDNPQLKIALLHVDTDIYEPASVILAELYDKVCRGGIIVFDDYGVFPGETKAVDEFFSDKNVQFEKLSLAHIPAFIVKT